ncbi:hypothetical protein [Dickeya fangzhongdai]|nr:hypothetical protein [Dickeya fangzhongdai]
MCEVAIDGTVYPVWQADFVVRLDGSTCLQLVSRQPAHRAGR